MKRIARILVAVKNPDSRHQPGVDKAIRIAGQLGASVELFHAISSPVFLELEPLTGTSLADLRREALELRRQRLEKLAARARRRGVAAQSTVEWDYPSHEAIVRRAIQARADLIVAGCHAGIRLKPWLIHLTDWELLRHSPVPVLLLKGSKPWKKPVILAAVDPGHAHDKPAALDKAIAAQAKRLATAVRGSVRLVHASMPAPLALLNDSPVVHGAPLTDVYLRLQAHARKLFDAFANRARIPRAARHFVTRDPVTAIPQAARDLGASIVVMGALSRSGLKRLFIGNTAERVLASLPCDVLVIKPSRFRSTIARKSRGMRVAQSPPPFPMPV